MRSSCNSTSSTTIRILSATYGPYCESLTTVVDANVRSPIRFNQRQQEPRLNPPSPRNDPSSFTTYSPFHSITQKQQERTLQITHTRDVLPYLQNLLLQATRTDDSMNRNPNRGNIWTWEGIRTLEIKDAIIPSNVNAVTLLEAGESMNTIFGDPCVGVTKKLSVCYVFLDDTEENSTDICYHDEEEGNDPDKYIRRSEYRPWRGTSRDCFTTNSVLSCSFFEHESIILKRFPSSWYNSQNTNRKKLDVHRNNMWDKRAHFRSDQANTSQQQQQQPLELPQPNVPDNNIYGKEPLDLKTMTTHQQGLFASDMDVTELVLPFILPFLEFRQRVQCQRVCKIWRFVVREWGLIEVLDKSDPSMDITPSFLRGVLDQSYASLHSLFLARFHELTPAILHPALPLLNKLRTLDISYCVQLDDSTLTCLSNHSKETLEVLYIKGLSKVTDVGTSCLAQSCVHLRVLDISFVNISDTSGILIGNHLIQLEALYFRDNHRLTNESIDLITTKCDKLRQLTLWGCIKVDHFSTIRQAIPKGSHDALLYSTGCEKLVLLNLWGVHQLSDQMASSIGHLSSLRTLIVSECQKLSDVFVTNLATSSVGPFIQHLHLRFVKNISDFGISAIARNMVSLVSLDLSFCTRISLSAVVLVLEKLYHSLRELRLYNCYQIDLTTPTHDHHDGTMLSANHGSYISDGIRLNGDRSALYMLDVRGCRGSHENQDTRSYDADFVRRMKSLGFEEMISGFFVRPQ